MVRSNHMKAFIPRGFRMTEFIFAGRIMNQSLTASMRLIVAGLDNQVAGGDSTLSKEQDDPITLPAIEEGMDVAEQVSLVAPNFFLATFFRYIEQLFLLKRNLWSKNKSNIPSCKSAHMQAVLHGKKQLLYYCPVWYFQQWHILCTNICCVILDTLSSLVLVWLRYQSDYTSPNSGWWRRFHDVQSWCWWCVHILMHNRIWHEQSMISLQYFIWPSIIPTNAVPCQLHLMYSNICLALS